MIYIFRDTIQQTMKHDISLSIMRIFLYITIMSDVLRRLVAGEGGVGWIAPTRRSSLLDP